MSISTSNITSGFVDLATYDEIEKYMYGGSEATAYFVRETRKSTWFTLVPVQMAKGNGTPGFNQQWSVNISRAGDYLLSNWLRVQTPVVTANTVTGQFGVDTRVRWTRNFMHNLVSICEITFNDLSAQQFTNYHLDFWAAFTTPAGKANGYKNMIGDFAELITPNTVLQSFTLNLPLPFFYTRDSGVALPTAALPYNEMKLSFTFRDWTQLLVVDNIAPGATGALEAVPTAADVVGTPTLNQVQVWGEYAIVSNDERKRMGCAPRDILIEQTQVYGTQNFQPGSGGNPAPQYDLRFSHAIKVIFFSVQNITCSSAWSNYTAASPVPGPGNNINYTPSGALDPILQTSLIYESTLRLSVMGSDYFSLVAPWYHAPVIPTETGYHVYSYSLDFISLDPKGSTNFGKLTNISIVPEASTAAITGANGSGSTNSGQNWVQRFRFVCCVVNNNIIRISGGALGFPVL